jgi:hypothetical protein
MIDQHHPRSVTDPAGVIVEMVAAAEPGLDASTITAAVVEVSATKVKQRVLAQALFADPELLTSARPHGPRSIERLIHALLARGAVHVVLPECARCRRTRPLVAFGACRRIACRGTRFQSLAGIMSCGEVVSAGAA